MPSEIPKFSCVEKYHDFGCCLRVLSEASCGFDCH